MQVFPWPLQVFAAILTLLAAVWDWRERRIPNWITVPALGGALLLRIAILGWPGLAQGFQGFALATLVYLLFYIVRAMGGGDLKLMAALGAVVGPTIWFSLFILISVLGAIIALVLLLWHRAFFRGLKRIGRILGSIIRGRAPYTIDAELDIGSRAAITSPHGVTIAAGTWLYLLLNLT